jgi:hypothetical protein
MAEVDQQKKDGVVAAFAGASQIVPFGQGMIEQANALIKYTLPKISCLVSNHRLLLVDP